MQMHLQIETILWKFTPDRLQAAIASHCDKHSTAASKPQAVGATAWLLSVALPQPFAVTAYRDNL